MSELNCYYCDKIVTSDPGYEGSEAAHDLGSAAPRCPRHWRYVCDSCGEPAHFMATGYDTDAEKLFCSKCATAREEVADGFWGWKYFFAYRSPWSDLWSPALDRLEYEGAHPLQTVDARESAERGISKETHLTRYPMSSDRWHARPEREFTDIDAQANWNRNADRWHTLYDEDGDPNRRYQSDEPMLEFLGEVTGNRILDVGSGNGYLCRKLARSGASMTGIELSDRFLEIAATFERDEPLGIDYRHGSASDVGDLPDAHFDKAVSNYTLMDIRDYRGALREVFRVLRPGGRFVTVISHPSFMSDPAGWVSTAPDSPRGEDRAGWRTDLYFRRGPYLSQWGDLDPVLSFHRPLRDYWEAFVETGFKVEGFEEPSITERGRRELPVSRVERALRIPYSCIFLLAKPGGAQ